MDSLVADAENEEYYFFGFTAFEKDVWSLFTIKYGRS